MSSPITIDPFAVEQLIELEQSVPKLFDKRSDKKTGTFVSQILKKFKGILIEDNDEDNALMLSSKNGCFKIIKAGSAYKDTVWEHVYHYLNDKLQSILQTSRCYFEMLVCRLPYDRVKYGTFTLAGKQFHTKLQDFEDTLNDESFLFPSSIFLRPELGCAQAACLFSVDNMQSVDNLQEINGLCTIYCKDMQVHIPKPYNEQYRRFESDFVRILKAYKRWIQINDNDSLCIFFIPSGFDGISRTALLCPVLLKQGHSCEQIRNLYFKLWMLARTVGAICENNLSQLIELREKEGLLLANTCTAVASIMSRNGSHNIGSHVLSALSHNVGTMPDDRVLYQYIQHRMDYIASATTGLPDWSVPTPFVGNLMKMFYSQRHLLEHIAESDGLHAYQYQGKGTQIGEGQMDCVKIVVRRVSRKEETEPGWILGDRNDGTPISMYEFFREKGAADQVVWRYDETVSVPGGILGQHAFYNIIENVIRNAAKHSWAGKSASARGSDNLVIFVDFENRQDIKLMKGMLSFTIGDNVSDVFPGKFWQVFFEKHNELLDAFIDPLDGPDRNGEKHSRLACLKSFIEDQTEKEKLFSVGLQHYVELYEFIKTNWDTGLELRNDKEFLALLKGKNPNDQHTPNKELGHRLPLPLHHRQEIALSEPFIDLETNRLRQAAWGLSEMKISAGYLRRSEVSVIGGLKPEESNELPLLVPVGIPRSEEGKRPADSPTTRDKLNYEKMCLAYRFWIALPKDVLIVADREDNWKSISKAGWEGIGVISYKSVFGGNETKGDIGQMSDYGFVVVDHGTNIAPNDQLKLPFRSLIVVDDEKSAAGMPYVLRSELNNASQDEFVPCVYKAWLNYLKRRRGSKNIPNPDKNLTIRLNIYEKKGAEKGLITDKDIYKVLFRECLHSVLESITVDVSISQLQRKALLLVSLYPLDEDDDLFKADTEMFTGNHRLNIENLLRKIAANVRNYLTSWPCSSEGEGTCSKWRRLTDAYRVGLKRAAETMRYPKIARELLNDLDTQPCISTRPCDSALLRELDAMATESAESGVIEAAVQVLDVARTTSDVFLRKYEERIVTLPPQYKESVKSNDKPLDFSRFGVQIAFEGEADISYNRHSTDDAPLYSEPLSGSQSYLNALANLSGQDNQWAMRLAENGLLRIVVIDERVRAFVVEHEEIRKTYESMHIAVVDTEKKPSFMADGTSLPEFNDISWNYVAGGFGDAHFDPDFDLVVIHQGIIDKWWSDHSQNAVKGILGKLRARNGSPDGRFVVVTTGRGRPDNIPETAKVLAFSTIETFLFKRYPEKLNFVNSLMSILPGSTERNGDND